MLTAHSRHLPSLTRQKEPGEFTFLRRCGQAFRGLRCLELCAVDVEDAAVAMLHAALDSGFVVAPPPPALAPPPAASEAQSPTTEVRAGAELRRRARLLRERGAQLAEGPAWAAGAVAALLEPRSETELAYSLDEVAIHRIELVRSPIS